MDENRKILKASPKVKKKMTKEQIQLAIIKKRTCDAKALDIVVKLLEPQVDPIWLIENLKNINKCHMEDVIEERAISKLCGYVLCQKPITVVLNQRYHISLKNKKVYDVTKRKNFCSSSCLGASNYLLEQMLTSPLWLRDKEEIPTFRIFCNLTKVSHGDEVDINIIEPCLKDDQDNTPDYNRESSINIDNSKNVGECIQKQIFQVPEEQEISESIEDFVLETIKNININDAKSPEEKNVFNNPDLVKSVNNELRVTETVIPEDKKIGKTEDFTKKSKSECTFKDKSKHEDSNIVKQVHVVNCDKNIVKDTSADKTSKVSENNTINSCVNEKSNYETNKSIKILHNPVVESITKNQNSSKVQVLNLDVHSENQNSEKLKHIKNKKRVVNKISIDINLAARVEQSFQEWFTEETNNFLFGDDSVKQKAIEKIEQQAKYSLLCQKLNKLQFQDQSDDVEIIQKPDLKPAPHFAVLKEEGEKLEIKVRAFYDGKTSIQESKKPTTIEESITSETFLPLTEAHAPQILRRKIFLDKLDQVLPDLLRTLAGNNEVFAKASINYTSVRCTTVKALVHTFSLSPKNIIFKSAEWTLVGLVIIKMLSLLDPWLANLLLSKQANMYISMILTSYKLDPHYLNLFVASFNPHVNPK